MLLYVAVKTLQLTFMNGDRNILAKFSDVLT